MILSRTTWVAITLGCVGGLTAAFVQHLRSGPASVTTSAAADVATVGDVRPRGPRHSDGTAAQTVNSGAAPPRFKSAGATGTEVETNPGSADYDPVKLLRIMSAEIG